MVLATNGPQVFTGHYQGMAYLPAMQIQSSQQVQQYTTTQGALPINQPVLKLQTVTKSPYSTKGSLPNQPKIHMTTTSQPRTITAEPMRNTKTFPPITYIQTKVDQGDAKGEYKPSIVMTQAGVQGQVKLPSSGIYRTVPSHFSRPGRC